MMPTLIVIIGATGVGKTELSLRVAEWLRCPILSADSRQMFRDLPIGTAAPTPEEQQRVQHYFVGNLPLDAYYSAAQYEQDVLQLTQRLFETYPTLVLTGGSMMYVDAVCNGIDDIPTILSEVRKGVMNDFEHKGLSPLLQELQRDDPQYHAIADHKNHKRIIHALEVIRQTGKPFSSFLTGKKKQRPFRIIKVGLQRPREELFDRINQRTTKMVEQGFIDEARRVLPFRHHNALNTVGYKELFRYLDGEWDLEFALNRLRKNTRVYAKKQMTWFAKDSAIHWFHPNDITAVFDHLKTVLYQEP